MLLLDRAHVLSMSQNDGRAGCFVLRQLPPRAAARSDPVLAITRRRLAVQCLRLGAGVAPTASALSRAAVVGRGRAACRFVRGPSAFGACCLGHSRNCLRSRVGESTVIEVAIHWAPTFSPLPRRGALADPTAQPPPGATRIIGHRIHPDTLTSLLGGPWPPTRPHVCPNGTKASCPRTSPGWPRRGRRGLRW